MKIVRLVIVVGLVMAMSGCASRSTGDLTTVQVREVQQVGSYTYLLVKAKGPEYWVAVPSMDASPGETYSYQGGMLMKDFYSQELDRTFEEVLFLEALFPGSSVPDQIQGLPEMGSAAVSTGSNISIERSGVRVEPAEGAITIEELYSNPSSYEGKQIRVTGEVVKFNPSIMERNWVHIQDGTEYEGKFDLTATSQESFEVGSVVTVEGTVALNRDFGYGYSYEILLEQTTEVSHN